MPGSHTQVPSTFSSETSGPQEYLATGLGGSEARRHYLHCLQHVPVAAAYDGNIAVNVAWRIRIKCQKTVLTKKLRSIDILRSLVSWMKKPLTPRSDKLSGNECAGHVFQ